MNGMLVFYIQQIEFWTRNILLSSWSKIDKIFQDFYVLYPIPLELL
jgi:hypothetical protein